MGNGENRLCEFARHRYATLGQDRFHLPQMVQIVTGHGFDHYLQCHIAAFGMIQRLVEICGPESLDECQVPLANRGERGQSHMSVIVRIGCGPVILIEWLDDMMILSQRLPQPEGKHNFAIRR